MKKKLGLVLSGGGARGAYQVGVLVAIQELSQSSGIPLRFDYLSGVSAGAINASSLASNAEDLKMACSNLTKLWSEINFEKVFATDSITMGRIGLQWARELSFGGLLGTTPGRALMNTDPLRSLLSDNMNYNKVSQNIKDGSRGRHCFDLSR